MDPKHLPTFRSRLTLVVTLLAGLFMALLTAILYFNFRSELRNTLRHRLENITTLAALQQNGDELVQVAAQNDSFYNIILARNAAIKRSDPDLLFVYTLRKDAQGIYFVVDARITPEEDKISEFGDRYDTASDLLKASFDSMTSTVTEPDFYTDEFGTFLSAYAPIYDSQGAKVGVLGVDISANTVVAQERTYFFRLFGIFLISLVFVGIGSYIAASYIASPIIGLRDIADRISKGEFKFRITNFPQTRELAQLAQDFNSMAENLNGLINDLEQRVEERTAGLTKKTDQLRAASFIARQSANVQDLTSLLEIVTNLITDQFGFYHAGIFLINESGDEAILQAASSEGGKRMLARGHALAVGSQGIVGYAAAQKSPRIALDVGSDAVYFNNPDLPLTRSEVALPLIVRNKVVGVLDIQSDQPQAFRLDDIDVLQTLADQVAVAIEDTRLLSESQAAIMQLEAVSTVRTREAWQKLLEERARGFTYTPLGIRADTSIEPSTAENRLKAEITLRGQKIGSIAIARKDQSHWSKLDEDLINEVAGQVGLAVDNLRLLEDAQLRARQEQTIGELATRFSRSLDLDSLLQTAARELGQLPDVAEVSVYIGQMPEQTPQKQRRTRRTTG